MEVEAGSFLWHLHEAGLTIIAKPIKMMYNIHVSFEQNPSEDAVQWTLSKRELETIIVSETEKIVGHWKKSKPGEVLSQKMIMDSVMLAISRSAYDESLIINLFIDGNDQDSAQLELRREGRNTWNIADRQVDSAYQGKGILHAFVRASEKFVESIARSEEDPVDHCIYLGTAQPHVFQVFEHFGYKAEEADAPRTDYLRHPERFADEVTVKNAWMEARNSTQPLELSNRDPYCFRRAAVEGLPHPTPRDAIRVTLSKMIRPRKNNRTIDIVEATRSEATTLM